MINGTSRLIRKGSLDTLKKDLMTIPIFYNNYIQYTKDSPKKQTEREKFEKQYKVWYSFSTLYQIFYAYADIATSDGNPNNIHYGRIECAVLREFGNGDKITLFLLYDCGIGNDKFDGNNIIGHFGKKGDISNLIADIRKNGYPGDDHTYLIGEKGLLLTLQEAEDNALEKLPKIINRKYPY